MISNVFVNGRAHDLSPHAGFRDPIADRALVKFQAEMTQNATALMQWFDRGGNWSSSEPDPRANVALEAGWPKNPTPEQFAWLYLTDAVAARVVEFMTKECWAATWNVYEEERVVGEDEEGTPFDQSWKELARTLSGGDENWMDPGENQHPLFSEMMLGDGLSGVNSYGGLYLTFDDGVEPDRPVAGISEEGSRPAAKDEEVRNLFCMNGEGSTRPKHWVRNRDARATKGRKLLGTCPLPETLATVVAWETNGPRAGQPIMYRVTQIDPTGTWSGASPPLTTLNVHYTRFVHFADWHHQFSSNKYSAHSRMRAVLPELLGGRKINAASEIAFWRNAILKMFLETHPQLGGDVLFNRSQTTDDFENMMNGFQQWMFLRGMHVNPVAPAVVDPTPHQLAKVQRICIKNGWPVRIFMGSEIGELASTQDKGNHAGRVDERNWTYVRKDVIGRTINRLILVGVLEAPQDTYKCEPESVQSEDPTEMAKILLARTQAAAAYVSGNVGQLIPEEAYLVDEMDVPEDRAVEYQAEAEKAIAEEEAQAQKLAEKRGFEPTLPDGFQKPEPPQPFPPQKLKPGEKLVQPKGPAPAAFNVEGVDWSVLVANGFNPDQPRDDNGRWASGGGTSAERLTSAIETVSKFDPGDLSHHRGLADSAVAELSSLPRGELHAVLTKAGIEGVRPSDSKTAMLQRLHNRLTAAVRARERAEV